MNKLPIIIETNATVEKIEGNVVIASGKEQLYDDVIMAVGSKSNDTSAYEKLDIPTHIIGDCKKANLALMRLEMHIMQYQILIDNKTG